MQSKVARKKYKTSKMSYAIFAHGCIKKLSIVHLKFNFNWTRHNTRVCKCTQHTHTLATLNRNLQSYTKSFKCHVLDLNDMVIFILRERTQN